MKRCAEDKNVIQLNQSKLVDRFNRHLNYLRLSITDRCNLGCVYCAPDACLPKLPQAEILTYEEIIRLVNIGIRLGITKVRITGGEPLVRKGVYAFLDQLTQLKELQDVSLTTNGILLKDHIEKIKSAGIKRLNISLDSLSRKKFQKITGRDGFPQVWEGIELAREAGFRPIKLNIVVLKGINDDELTDFAKLSFTHPYHIRFIEYMPIGRARVTMGQNLLVPQIKKRIQTLGKLMPVQKEMQEGPAERFKFDAAVGEIGFIRPISHHFCSTCNRLRLTADGRLRTCLLSEEQFDLKKPLRSGCSDQEISEHMRDAVSHKPLKHNLASNQSSGVSGQMSAIGG